MQVLFSEHQRPVWLLVLLGASGVALISIGVAGPPLSGGWVSWVAIVSGLLCLVGACGMRVQLTQEELVIYADFALHRRRLPLCSIKHVTLHRDLRPMRSGGYGWRILTNGTAYLMFRGTAIEVETDRARITFTSPRATELIALLRDLLPQSTFDEHPAVPVQRERDSVCTGSAKT